MSTRRKIVLGVLLLALVLFAGGGWMAYNAMEAVKKSYAVWWVADMVIVHLEANGNAWPKNWNELADDYETCVRESGRPWTFEELQSRVDVDWNADSQRLAAAARRGEPLRVVWLADGSTYHYQGREPNEMVGEYFRSDDPKRASTERK